MINKKIKTKLCKNFRNCQTPATFTGAVYCAPCNKRVMAEIKHPWITEHSITDEAEFLAKKLRFLQSTLKDILVNYDILGGETDDEIYQHLEILADNFEPYYQDEKIERWDEKTYNKKK